MKTKQIIGIPLTRKDLSEIKLLTSANIAYKLLGIFSNHIGADNAISRGKLFRKIFNRSEEITLADELRWDFVKRAMHLCRQRTKCFIGSRYDGGLWKYFVVESFSDAQYYCNTLEKNISRMRAMQQKAMKAVRQKWYRLDWLDDSIKQIGVM